MKYISLQPMIFNVCIMMIYALEFYENKAYKYNQHAKHESVLSLTKIYFW